MGNNPIQNNAHFPILWHHLHLAAWQKLRFSLRFFPRILRQQAASCPIIIGMRLKAHTKLRSLRMQQIILILHCIAALWQRDEALNAWCFDSAYLLSCLYAQCRCQDETDHEITKTSVCNLRTQLAWGRGEEGGGGGGGGGASSGKQDPL